MTDSWFQRVQSALPKPEKITTPWVESLWSECDYYGASYIISRKLQLDHVPKSQAMWSHGWNHYPCEHRELYRWGWHGQNLRLLVHREEEQRFLRGCGFDDATAVGAPFLYADPTTTKKIPGSLLIVPFHSLDHVKLDYDEESYFLKLDPFLRKFGHVAACIHPSCAQKGTWLRALQSRSIPWTFGVEVIDRNGLKRIRRLFEHFTHVTSNSIGSHIPYAAACDCSVSLFGPQLELRPSDWSADPYYKEHPQILEWMINLQNSHYVEKTYGWLFREPTADANDRDWALRQLGQANMKTPAQLAKLFGWDVPNSTLNQKEVTGRLVGIRRRLARLFR